MAAPRAGVHTARTSRATTRSGSRAPVPPSTWPPQAASGPSTRARSPRSRVLGFAPGEALRRTGRTIFVGDSMLHLRRAEAERELQIDHGPGADLYARLDLAAGFTREGRPWIVYEHVDPEGSELRVALERDGELAVSAITARAAFAFLPAAAIDSQDRLHVAYYQTAGEQGRLEYRIVALSDGVEVLGGSLLDADAAPAMSGGPVSTMQGAGGSGSTSVWRSAKTSSRLPGPIPQSLPPECERRACLFTSER